MTAPNMHAHEREALRQQLLLRALWREPGAPLALRGWLASTPQADEGLAAYRGNAAAVAARALAATYPTVAALLGDDAFAALAQHLWREHPPARGDLAEWGDALPAFIAGQESLAGEPYLADAARLDGAVHRASRAADAPSTPAGLDRLAQVDTAALRLQLAPGSALVHSRWPVASIWQAHQRSDDARFDGVRAAFAAGRGEAALVVREGLPVRVHALDEADAAFTRALLDGATLAAALDRAGPAFAFDCWLARALSQRWLAAVCFLSPEEPSR